MDDVLVGDPPAPRTFVARLYNDQYMQLRIWTPRMEYSDLAPVTWSPLPHEFSQITFYQ